MMWCAPNVRRPGGKKFAGRLAWLVLLVPGLVWGLGCGAREPRLGPGHEFSQGLRPASEDTARLLHNAHYFKLMGQPELAMKELEAAHRRDPGNIRLANALAQFYDELGLRAQAQQTYQETLALEPDNPVLNNNLCFSYYLGGDWRQAEACFRKTLARQPHNQAARNNLGLVLCREGRQEEARRLWQESEGEAAAARKIEEVLAILNPAGGPAYAQQPRPLPEEQAHRSHLPVAAPPAPGPVAARVPAPAPRSETGPPAAAPAKLAAAPPPAPRLPAREIPAPRPAEARVTAVKPAPAAPSPRVAGPPPEVLRPGSPGPAAPAAPAPKVHKTAAAPAGRPEPPKVAAALPRHPAPPARPAPLTTRELVETNIAILNGNGTPDLARETRSRLTLEGFSVVDINNYRDFGVNRTVIYYRPDSERVATALNKKFFPGAEVEAAPQLAGNIDVKVILGRDLFPQAHAEAMETGKKNSL